MPVVKEKELKEKEPKIDKSSVNKSAIQLKKCFVITPIGDENSEIRRQIDGVIDECIIPILDEFEVCVSHRIYKTGSINSQIISHIYDDDLVIANLTNLNPNVMYELAFRHSIQKPVIVIKNKNDGCTLPFDILEDRTIFYTNDITGTGELKENLKKFLKGIDFSAVMDNPISRAIKDLKVRESFEKNDASDEVQQGEMSYIIRRLNVIESKIDRDLRKLDDTYASYHIDSNISERLFKYYAFELYSLKQEIENSSKDSLDFKILNEKADNLFTKMQKDRDKITSGYWAELQFIIRKIYDMVKNL